jgi:hypothetical protein
MMLCLLNHFFGHRGECIVNLTQAVNLITENGDRRKLLAPYKGH